MMHGSSATLRRAPYPGYVFDTAPRNVYWETTIACDLACRHCRADAIKFRHPDELRDADASAFLKDIKSMGSMLIMTGGDPMKRPDLFELIAEARGLGVPVSITPSTTPSVTEAAVARFRELGVAAMGVSLDGPTAEIHDSFRGVPGTFEHACRTLELARTYHMPVQVNTTVTKDTIPHLDAMYELLKGRFAPPVRRWSLFLLVPMGRGAVLRAPDAAAVERLFAWVYDRAEEAPFHVSTVEAPHYRRYWVSRKLAAGMATAELDRVARNMGFGVRDGNGVIFVSHTGDVYPAGFLAHPKLGNVRETPLSVIYRENQDLLRLRDAESYAGKCGRCEFKWTCGGSRARAWSMTGDPLGSDPLCGYEPVGAPLAAAVA